MRLCACAARLLRVCACVVCARKNTSWQLDISLHFLISRDARFARALVRVYSYCTVCVRMRTGGLLWGGHARTHFGNAHPGYCPDFVDFVDSLDAQFVRVLSRRGSVPLLYTGPLASQGTPNDF